jgi:hypothetical protein
MAKIRSQATTRIAVDSNIAEQIAWFKYLSHGRFTKRYGHLFRQHGDIVETLTVEARAVARKYVYDVYTPKTAGYQRSYNLFYSMRAIGFVGKALANIDILSDTNIRGVGAITKWSPHGTARVKGTDSNPPKHARPSGNAKNLLDKIWSYAAFFINPTGFNSFIPKRGKPRRDFLSPLTTRTAKILKAHQVTVAAMAMRENKPD